MAVMLFEPESLLSQIGHSGLSELYNELALRMRRHTGIINPAGRYYDRCFLVLFETMHSPRWLGTLSLGTASSLRQPVELTSLSGEWILVRADIGSASFTYPKGARVSMNWCMRRRPWPRPRAACLRAPPCSTP